MWGGSMYTVPPNPRVPAPPAGESLPAGSQVATGGYLLVCHHVRLVIDALSGGVVWWGHGKEESRLHHGRLEHRWGTFRKPQH